ncbi:Hypoxanthine-guanine phosphoribosyltransferase [subsurface metagenome]
MIAQPKPHVLFTKEEVEATVKKLAAEIRKDYQGKCPLLIGILKGSFVFMADLIRLLNFPLEVEFITLSSYGRGRESSGKIRVVKGLRAPIKGRDVLVIEDIVDTGLTISFLLDYLSSQPLCSFVP